jgi:predicted flap endonuclease-1-like 5' DNA nuclease
MSVWQALIIGLLAGWVIEWVIDWLYWRGRVSGLTAEIGSLTAERDRLRADLDVARRDAAEVGTLRTALADCRANGERLAADLKTAGSLAPQLRAELERTKGELVTAQGLAGERQTTIDRLEAELRAARETPQRTALFTEAPTLGAPAVLGTVAGVATADGLHSENQRLRGELESLRSSYAALRRDQRDPLIDINGIGPVYEKKLFDAGVNTFDDLSAMTPDQVLAIIKPERWQDIDAVAWIAEAATMAQRSRPSPLRVIDGIGVVYEKKLFDANIYTFEQLAALSPDQVRDIIKPEEWQKFEPEAWIAEARARAATMQRSAAV